LPPELIAQKEGLLKDRVAIEMKRYFENDFRRIGHASRVARYAERIGKKEKGNLAVILTAAYLHDIGIHEAEKKHGSTAAEFQEAEGRAVARCILQKLGAKDELIDEVCDIIGHHHHPRSKDTINFKVVYDSDLLENTEEKKKNESMENDELRRFIEKSFLTAAGRETAKEILLGG
jgi:HD superfamily phosphodiesterase